MNPCTKTITSQIRGRYESTVYNNDDVFALNGCVRATHESYVVRITDTPEMVSNCKQLGFVRASDRLFAGLLKGVAASHVDTAIRNQAGRMGADTVLMTAEHTSYWTGSAMKGEAYKCHTKD